MPSFFASRTSHSRARFNSLASVGNITGFGCMGVSIITPARSDGFIESVRVATARLLLLRLGRMTAGICVSTVRIVGGWRDLPAADGADGTRLSMPRAPYHSPVAATASAGRKKIGGGPVHELLFRGRWKRRR
jgi:hypothetical protein